MTRIVAGIAGGRKLDVPAQGTRPTAERVREALFSALEAVVDIEGARVLDLYAGSGALGLEALSRGAALATFVESDRKAVAVLKRNAKTLGLQGVDVRFSTAQSALIVKPTQPYHILFADPPYAVTNAELAAVLNASLVWLEPESIAVIERATHSGDLEWPPGFEPLRTKRYGDTVLHWGIVTESG